MGEREWKENERKGERVWNKGERAIKDRKRVCGIKERNRERRKEKGKRG